MSAGDCGSRTRGRARGTRLRRYQPRCSRTGDESRDRSDERSTDVWRRSARKPSRHSNQDSVRCRRARNAKPSSQGSAKRATRRRLSTVSERAFINTHSDLEGRHQSVGGTPARAHAGPVAGELRTAIPAPPVLRYGQHALCLRGTHARTGVEFTSPGQSGDDDEQRREQEPDGRSAGRCERATRCVPHGVPLIESLKTETPPLRYPDSHRDARCPCPARPRSTSRWNRATDVHRPQLHLPDRGPGSGTR